MRDITLGQYFPADSILHRLDPRVKLISPIAFIVITFCTGNFFSLGIVLLSVIAVALLSKVPIKMYIKSLKVIVVIVLITSALNLFYGTGEPIARWWIFKITADGITNAVNVCTRIICLILFSSALTFTTSPTDLTDALERLMKPLTIFHVHVHEIAMMMTIALRFIPTMLEETEKIMNAQKARGADLSSGNPFKRIKALIPVLIPLIVSAFQRALDLATAMECRCYRGSKGRTKLVKLKSTPADAVALLLFAVVLAGVYLGNAYIPIGIRVG